MIIYIIKTKPEIKITSNLPTVSKKVFSSKVNSLTFFVSQHLNSLLWVGMTSRENDMGNTW